MGITLSAFSGMAEVTHPPEDHAVGDFCQDGTAVHLIASDNNTAINRRLYHTYRDTQQHTTHHYA